LLRFFNVIDTRIDAEVYAPRDLHALNNCALAIVLTDLFDPTTASTPVATC
jgi:hypothetical protein